jgi:virginiamycin A acetyltransferase
MEGGPAFSLTIREILRKFYRIDIGLYTHWPFRMKPAVFHPGTTFGRYSYIADTVRTFTLNHPMNVKSTHGFFYNPLLGKIKTAPLPRINLVIGHGVWIGHNTIILPPTERIGDGAIITAGSVVHTNVPPYSVVSGHPARVMRYRFSPQIITELLASRWWEKSPGELVDGGPLKPNLDGLACPEPSCNPPDVESKAAEREGHSSVAIG